MRLVQFELNNGQRRVGVTLARAGDVDAARAVARAAAEAIGIEIRA